MNIFFRTDASVETGTGHVMRCLALAEELKRRGSDICFICREENGNLIALIKELNYRVSSLPAETDTESEIKLIQNILENEANPPEWLIVDHYGIDCTWESSFRNLVKKIMVIDDLAITKHDCDLLLNQNYITDSSRYKDLVAEQCTTLLGPAYALLRPEFRTARETLRKHTGHIKHILVFLGGSDANNYTSGILRAIKSLDIDHIAIDVVIGSSNPNRQEIESLASAMPNTTCHFSIQHMAELMASSDIAIGAGGITTWERCCLGLPAMVISIAENQTEISQRLADDGYILYLGNANNVTEQDIRNDLKFLLRHPEIVRGLSTHAKQLTDGQGTKKVSDYLCSLNNPVRLRPAAPADCKRSFEWRNHPETREVSLDPSPLSWESHERWYSSVLSSPHSKLLIGEINSAPVGVLRYDLKRNKATVSIYLDPELKNRGIGTSMLKLGNSWLKENHPEIDSIIAEIKPNNAVSIRSFAKAGFHADYLTMMFS